MRYICLIDWKRYMYLFNQKETLPIDEVDVPHQPEGKLSSQRGTCTSSTGRVCFRLMRYICLIDWKETLPVKTPHGGGTRAAAAAARNGCQQTISSPE
jgi:hypothetical protein